MCIYLEQKSSSPSSSSLLLLLLHVYLSLYFYLFSTISRLGIFQHEVTRQSAAAFRHFVGVVTSPPVKSEYSRFTKIVNAYLEAPPFNYTNPYKHLGAGKKVNVSIASLVQVHVCACGCVYRADIYISIAL